MKRTERKSRENCASSIKKRCRKVEKRERDSNRAYEDRKQRIGCACCGGSKSGTVKSLKDCAPMVGYSVSQLTRWWERYRAEGLAGVLKQQKPAGKASRLTAEAWAGLLQAMRAGHIVTMQDARNYLEREWGISYKNGKSLWWLFKKHRVKWKTRRRRHKKANAEQQAAFKKTLPAC